jgi:universal stress protein A
MKFGALALDYDGTMATDGVMHADVRHAIGDVRQRGVIVVLQGRADDAKNSPALARIPHAAGPSSTLPLVSASMQSAEHATETPTRAEHFRRVRTAGTVHVLLRQPHILITQTAGAFMIAIENILIPTDFEEAADTALTYGRALAERFGATLHVLHVPENICLSAFAAENYAALYPQIQRDVENAARARLAELVIDSDHSGPKTRAVVLTSNAPALTIVDYAKDHRVDLIVMGTHGRGALAHLIMGSVAERVVRLAPCPVLTVRHPEHEFVRPDSLVAVARAHSSAA